MGWITLLVFPIPAFIALYFFADRSLIDFFELQSLTLQNIVMGTAIGTLYALFIEVFEHTSLFKSIPMKVDELVKSMNLSWKDALFLSICAGIGEELLFRCGVQFFLGPIFTSIIFVAAHGYLNPFNWRQSLYGIVVLPLTFLLAYGYEYVGLWFSIFIHIAYDFTIFTSYIKDEQLKD